MYNEQGGDKVVIRPEKLCDFLHSEWKVLAKIQPSVMCAHMVDFHKSGHIPHSRFLSRGINNCVR